VFGIGVGDDMHFDVGREGGFGRLAGEDGDGEVAVCVQGGEDRGSDVAAGLNEVLSICHQLERDGVFRTPMIRTFLINSDIL